MVKAQEWLNKNYSKIHKDGTQELDLRNLNLEGDLDLEGFSSSLNKIYLTGNPKLGKIKDRYAIYIYQNTQEFLNHQYPDKSQVVKIYLGWLDFEQPSELILDNYPNLKEIYGRNISNITKITISNCPKLEEVNTNNFENNQQLILHNLPSLKDLNCSESKLTILDLSKCFKLEFINCFWNKLNEIKLPKGEKLKKLDLSNNNFKQDLSFLQGAVNLEKIDLRNNKFYGSLEYLKNMRKLKVLDVSYTSIDSGLEYLPENIKDFGCLPGERKVQVIYNLFANEQGEVETDYGYIKNFPQKLQEYKQKATEKQKARELLKEEFQEKDSLITELQTELQNLGTENNHLKSQLNKMEELLRAGQQPQILHQPFPS